MKMINSHYVLNQVAKNKTDKKKIGDIEESFTKVYKLIDDKKIAKR